MPEGESAFDVVVVGSGPGGRTASLDLAKHGLSVALIEAELVGGDCAYWACIPSKALLRPPEALGEARHVEGASRAVRGDTVDARSVLARRDRFVDNWDDTNMQRSLEQSGIHIIHGRGELAGKNRVSVHPRNESDPPFDLIARRAVILSTGSRTAYPKIDGLTESNPWNSRNATGTHHVPESIAILGMGAVACEMASAMSSLGSKEVTIIGRDARLLSRYEPFVGEKLGEAFRKRGIRILTDRSVKKVARTGDPRSGPFQIWLDDGSKVSASELLVATGREPNTKSLGLESVGLRSGQWLDVDDTCLVKGVEGGWLFAVGDINHRALLTHVAKYQGRVCANAILERSQSPDAKYAGALLATSDHDMVPQVVFTDPEVASVGFTDSEARKRGLRIRVVHGEMGGMPGAALHEDGYSGHACLIIDEDERIVVGATFIGPQVGDLLHAATIAVTGRVRLDLLWHSIPPFPTVNEIWLDLLGDFGDWEGGSAPPVPKGLETSPKHP